MSDAAAVRWRIPWSFNDERVARAIFASQIPIVSAVGHETDVTIADFVADLRAPTPSAAAEIVSRNQQELLRQLQSGQQRLEMAMDYFLASRQRRFTQLFHRLQQQHPQLRLARQQTALERLRQRMRIAVESQLKRAEQRQKRTVQRLNHYNPQPRIHRAQSRIQQLEYRLAEIMRGRLSERRERFGNAVTHLEAVSPEPPWRGLQRHLGERRYGAEADKTGQNRRFAHHPPERRLGRKRSEADRDGEKTRARKPSPTKPAE